MRFPSSILRLPDWIDGYVPEPGHVFSSVEERMELVIALSRLNIQHGTGGPFGAGIFEQDTGVLLAPGVNLVAPAHCSNAHAEMVAIAIAQRVVGRYDLGGQGLPRYELVASTEPCAMCFGAICWSGVRSLVCGARSEDACSVGFDEGPKPVNWAESLEKRGITVVRNVLRDDAAEVLRQYRDTGGLIYNGRRGSVS